MRSPDSPKRKRGLRAADVFTKRQRRRNLRALLRYLAFVLAVVAPFSILFHVIMIRFEGQSHSWITGPYWTVSTMTTLGLGDIVFKSDIGKLFTIIVLLSGILLVFVVLPFAFIRYVYAPWLEKRRVPERMAGHVVISSFDNITPALVEKLELHGVPYFVIEPDPTRASTLDGEGISVVTGTADDRSTYERLRIDAAQLVLANHDDMTNTNVVLTIRDLANTVPIAAVAESEASVEILRTAGATHVLSLKQQLGEQLANRLNAGHAQTHVIGSYRDLLIAEFPVHNTPFEGKTLREIRLREITGLNIVGVLEQARFLPAQPDTRLTAQSVPVVIGTRQSMKELDELLVIYDANYSPVLVIGGGEVGCTATRLLKRKGVPVHMVEKNPERQRAIGDTPDRLFIGEAADPDVLAAAGMPGLPGVLITTHDDATNIYLTVHCRRLDPKIRIVSRITHDRNMSAIRRAGADLALSLTSLGVASAFAVIRGHELVILGEGIELHEMPVPQAIIGKTLETAGIAARTGLNVIAIQEPSSLITNPKASTSLSEGSTLCMIGNRPQLEAFRRAFG
jgi:Trk K+ transport system NAD-binding subunit